MINSKLIYEVYKLRGGDEQYCFPLRMFLGKNGLYESHPLKGRIFIKKETNVEFSVDSVYVHYWDGGYYYVALARNSENSHAGITWNINCPLEGYTLENYYLKS